MLTRPIRSGIYEPRVIRPPDAPRSSCIDITLPPPATRNHRASTSNTPTAVSSAQGAGSLTSSQLSPHQTVISLPNVPFQRPAYLEHSSLKHLLQTEFPPILPPGRYGHDVGTLDDDQNSRDFTLPIPRRRRTPLIESDDEGPFTPPRDLPPIVSTYPTSSIPLSPVLRLPTRWSDQDRHLSLLVSPDGRELTFVGISCIGDKDAAAARVNHSIPAACGIYYFEVGIVNKGQKGQISIGFSGPDVRLSRLPGWEKHSWGYHGDDGFSFSAEKMGSPYGPTYSTGDVIGCGIDFSQHRAFYTKNGDLLGSVFDNIGKDSELYPSVGLRHQNESVRINLGHDPFLYDIEDHVNQQRSHVWSMIQGRAVSPSVITRIANSHALAPHPDPSSSVSDTSEESTRHQDQSGKRMKGVIDGLVFDYLVHHGYVGAARAFYTQMRRSTPDRGPGSRVDAYSLDARSNIVKSLIAGDVDSALNDTTSAFPAVLERKQGLMLFKLRCRKFVELMLIAADALKRTRGEYIDGRPRRAPAAAPTEPAQISLANALTYGQKLELEYKNDTRPEIATYLKRAFSVVAYEDPLNVPGEVGEIAGQKSRNILAMEMNEAILEVLGKPTQPVLEYVYRQTGACLVQLGLMGVGSAVFADPTKEFFE